MRDKQGGKLFEVQKCKDPIWCLAFQPQKFDSSDNVLAIGSWDEQLSLFQVSQGKELKPIGQEKKLGFDPLSITYFQNGEFFIITGTNRKVTLWNKDGI